MISPMTATVGAVTRFIHDLTIALALTIAAITSLIANSFDSSTFSALSDVVTYCLLFFKLLLLDLPKVTVHIYFLSIDIYLALSISQICEILDQIRS